MYINIASNISFPFDLTSLNMCRPSKYIGFHNYHVMTDYSLAAIRLTAGAAAAKEIPLDRHRKVPENQAAA
jgi:hypothetical protein